MMQRIVLTTVVIALMIMPGRIAPAQTVLTDVWKDKDHRIAVKKSQSSGSRRFRRTGSWRRTSSCAS
jgi:hypothetical protein